MSAVVVLPTYQERANIEAALDGLLAVEGLHVLVVDDSSPDGTADAALAHGARVAPGRVEVLSRPVKDGLGGAYRAGFRRALDAGYDVVLQMDADGSHPAVAVPHMIDLIEGGYDLVLGSRYIAGGSLDDSWPLGRRLLSRGGNWYARQLLRSTTADLTAGFKAWRAATLAAVGPENLTAAGYAFQIQGTVLATDLGARVVEIPIHFTERQLGTSQMSRRIVAEASVVVLQLARARRRAPVARLAPATAGP